MGEFDIEYISRIAIKAQALVDFVAEFTGTPKLSPDHAEKSVDVPGAGGSADAAVRGEKWKLFVDGSSNSAGAGAGLVLLSPDQYKTSQALRFNFKASNNEVEYEAVIAGLGLARELGVQDLEVFSDSMLIVN